jgi:hypothetical protein
MKTTVKTLLLILVLLLLAACGSNSAENDAGAGSNGQVNVPRNFDEYQSNISGISFQHPSSWVVIEEGSSNVTLASDAAFARGSVPDEPYAIYVVNVTGRAMAGLGEEPTGEELAEYLVDQFSQFGIYEDGVIEQEPTATTLNGAPAANGKAIIGRGTTNESTNEFWVFLDDDRLVNIISVTSGDETDEFDETFAAINSTVAVEAPNIALVEGVETDPDQDRAHDANYVYPDLEVPPIGGIHHPNWQNCGIYEDQISILNAIHSLEHGAVWVTYQPELSATDIGRLQEEVRGEDFALLSPFPNQRSPIVLSAWGVRLELTSADDERIAAFLDTYQQGPQTPEPGASCQGGTSDTLN